MSKDSKARSLGYKFFKKAKAGDYSQNKPKEEEKYNGQDQSPEAKAARRKAREAARGK
jgi:hypothetical protein